MRKTYQMILALALMVLGATNVNAGELISLQEVPFGVWEGWGIDAKYTGPADCAWVLGEATGQPYGDGSVNNRADLSQYSKLIVTVTEGTPRFLFNRDVAEGQWNADESQSHLIEYPKDGWSSKYFSVEDNVYTVDLKQILKDKGFCHLHAIKGANWANVTVESMMVEKADKAAQVGWTNLVNNSDMEGDDVSSFVLALDAVVDQGTHPAEITDGIGVDGSRGIMVQSMDNPTETWQTQFFVKLNETLPEGTKWRFSMNYRADQEAESGSGIHVEPRAYKGGNMFDSTPYFTTDWQTFSKEGTIKADQAGMGSVAFDLNTLKVANKYYFDNVIFEIFKLGTVLEFGDETVKVDFGFDTNLAELVKKGGKSRLVFPEGCVTVTANGQELTVHSVEAYADGRFYIFVEEGFEQTAEVVVTFKNPADANFNIKYTSGPSAGETVKDFTETATYNSEMEGEFEDVYAWDYGTPVVIAADPEDGSFNLPNSIKEFKVTFDNKVDAAALKATLNGKALKVVPAEGTPTEVTLVREGDDLPTGKYAINVTKIFDPGHTFGEEAYGDTTYYVSIGKVEYDPNDTVRVVMSDGFDEAGASQYPAGWQVQSDNVLRSTAADNWGSGSRLMGGYTGDITTGLYLCSRGGSENYAAYGANEPAEEKLKLGIGKYELSFQCTTWDSDNWNAVKVQVLDPNEEVVTEFLSDALKMNCGNSKKESAGAPKFSLKFNVVTEGNYVLKFYAVEIGGSFGGWDDGIFLGNVVLKYVPDALGLEETLLLNTALQGAKAARDDNNDPRYDGAAFDALKAAITKYETEMEGYTAPSKFKSAAAALDEAAQTMRDHRKLCDNYDTQIKAALDVVRNNAENKFANTDLYKKLSGIVAKYNGSSEKVIAEDGTETQDVKYTFDQLKEDPVLAAAIDELQEIVTLTGTLFTEGESADGQSGVKVLVDRIRQGAEGLKQLGVANDDWIITAANNALTDDDNLAEDMKNRIKTEFYGKMKDGGNGLFNETVNEETGDVIKDSYNMTVFVKNPNIYVLRYNTAYSEENVPGWSVTAGNPGMSNHWSGNPQDIEGVAWDLSFTTYRAVARMEQTITDLPAGKYNVTINAASWADDDKTDGYVFLKTSATPAPVEGGEESFYETQSLEYYGQYVANHDNVFENVEIKDGQLTLGCNFGPGSQWFFNSVKIALVGPADGFDYVAAYESALTGIDTVQAKGGKVVRTELFDLNGRRLSKAGKGITIVKKVMGDGSVKTEKVIVK